MDHTNTILPFLFFLVIEAYDAAERSMVRLNKTGAELMHKYGGCFKCIVFD